jgi:hypothetical protein
VAVVVMPDALVNTPGVLLDLPPAVTGAIPHQGTPAGRLAGQRVVQV